MDVEVCMCLLLKKHLFARWHNLPSNKLHNIYSSLPVRIKDCGREQTSNRPSNQGVPRRQPHRRQA